MENLRSRIHKYLSQNLLNPVSGRRMAAVALAWTAGTREIQMGDGRTGFIPTGENADQLVELAKKDGAAWDACLALISGCIERGEPVPQTLRKIAIAALRNKDSGPSKKTVWENLHRDLVLCMAIAILEREGDLPPTRNDASESESGCDLVAEEAGEILRKEIAYGTLKKIWLHHREHIYAVLQHGPHYMSRTNRLLLRLKKR